MIFYKEITSLLSFEHTKLMPTEFVYQNLESMSSRFLSIFESFFSRVFTVFSTSRDHGQGHGAVAGCILVDVDKIQVINRSPAYKNKYIHHRTSIGCDLTDDQVHFFLFITFSS